MNHPRLVTGKDAYETWFKASSALLNLLIDEPHKSEVFLIASILFLVKSKIL